ACRRPPGLSNSCAPGTDPTKFRAYLEAEMGKRAAELATVAPGQQGEHTDTSGHGVLKSEQEMRREGRLRAILRAPELVQFLYRDGLISQAAAAKMGPSKPTPEQAAQGLASAVAPWPVAGRSRPRVSGGGAGRRRSPSLSDPARRRAVAGLR